MPLDPTACERRVYRLAVLLTGDRVAGARVIEEVLGAQPDLRELDDAHIDRLTVLRSREVRAAAIRDDAVGPETADAVAALDRQPREAWVFTRVYRLGPRELARAMDCSVTASQRHLERADRAMRDALGGRAAEAPPVLLGFSHALEVPAFYRADQASRRRRRLVLVATVVIVLVAALAAIVLGVLRGAGDAGAS
ncbi:MAG: hypothetical protein GY715_09055 [Planctomycetes bacterium]|nr:hypothetical protein [Planctomycetota bacterium]